MNTTPNPDHDDGTLSWVVHDEDGTELDRGSQPIDSYVVQWAENLRAVLANTNPLAVTDITGTDQQVAAAAFSNNFLSVKTGSGPTDEGIAIGTDGTNETITDFSLGAKATSNIGYRSTTVDEPEVNGPTVSIAVTREFKNNRSSSVTVNEVGLIAVSQDGGGTPHSYLILRDTGSPILTIASGAVATIQYSLEFSV